MKHWVLFLNLAFCILVGGCIVPETRQDYWANPVYYDAAPEYKKMIEEGLINIGMTIEECRLSWWKVRNWEKVRSSSTARGTYELWRLKGGRYDLYFHVDNGVVTRISEYSN
jgi:hypothetical protein